MHAGTANENGLLEPIAILDVVATALPLIEDLGDGLRRLIFTAPHPTPQGVERHIVAKLVIPEACLLPISRALLNGADEALVDMLTLVPGRNSVG